MSGTLMRDFEVRRDAAGRWRAKRTDGLVEGIFRDQEDALRFVRRESLGGRQAAQPFQKDTMALRRRLCAERP